MVVYTRRIWEDAYPQHTQPGSCRHRLTWIELPIPWHYSRRQGHTCSSGSAGRNINETVCCCDTSNSGPSSVSGVEDQSGIISESAYLIWKIRCKRLFESGPNDEQITQREIHNRWVKTINNRLNLDRAMTNKKHTDNAIPRKKVLQTWRRTIQNEKELPADWTTINGVIVSIGQMERHAKENQTMADMNMA